MRLLLAIAVTATVAAGIFTFTQQQGPSADDFCAQLARVRDLDETLATLDPLAIAGVAAQLRSLESRSPDEIRDEVSTLVDFTDDLVDAVETTPGSETAAVEAAARAADLGAVTDAGRGVERYASERCDIDLTPETTPESIAPPPTRPTATTR